MSFSKTSSGTFRRVLSAAFITGVSALPFAQVSAQNADQSAAPVELETVVVTAQKRSQAVKDVPLAITAFTASDIDRENFTDFERLSTRTPGFFVQQSTDSSASFVMRGIEAGNAGAIAEPSISFFLNDVDTSRSRGLLKELFDVERVEVAKGPQGTLYGRGSEIGAVAVYTKKANTGLYDWNLEGQLGNYDLYSVGGMINVPLVENKLALRVAARRREREGFQDILSASKPAGSDDLWAARVSLRYEPSDEMAFDLIVDHQADNDNATITKALSVASPGTDTNPFTTFDRNALPVPQQRRQTGVTLLGDWKLSDSWTLNSITGYREVTFQESWDGDGTSYPFILPVNNPDNQWLTSQEFRLRYDNQGRFKSVMGVSFYKDRTKNELSFIINEQYLLAGFPRVLTPVTTFMGMPVTTGNQTDLYSALSRDSVSAYGNITYAVTDRLVVDAGLRYTRDDATVRQRSTVSTIDGIAPIALRNGLSNSLGQTFSHSETYGLTTPRLAVTYKLNDTMNIYAGVSKGIKAGYPQISFAAPVGGVAQPAYSEVKSEEVINIEVGFKGNIAPRTYVEAIAFSYDYNDFQTRSQDLTKGTINAGKASAYGLELLGRTKITPELTLNGSYTYLHTQYDEFFEVVGGTLVDYSGNSFRLAPEHTASISADYRRPISANWQGYGNVNYSWKSEYFFNNDNLTNERQEAFGLTDLRLGVERQDGTLRLEAYAENLFDTQWYRDVGNTGKSFGISTVIPAAPRFFGVRLTVSK
ncbi:TonB-dependent receptor [Asticcacaulis sp. SL142]|uniref:TonB-dependent receptor n=1 Tax=Asticcacaulis sp. SL142 TaxID=2995155 RepID=UPI00226CE8ED|nr:TonB-dependent receptor [Asticcacaulis sp. SL142]WAC47178.1 TonB-dependent receptor [Asticcacaulis sp. SL142]